MKFIRDQEIRTHNMIEAIAILNKNEYWWNVLVKISIKCKQTNLIYWFGIKKRDCTVVEISCPVNINIKLKIIEKSMEKSEVILSKFRSIPVIIGALKYVKHRLKAIIDRLYFSNIGSRKLIRRRHSQSITGTVKKNCKTFQKIII